jgi:formate/nitrite transporter FocA (FNT family)
MSESSPTGLSEPEQASVEDMAAPRSLVIHEVVRRQGEEELNRPVSSLFWSGIAAGVTITVSVIAEAALERKLPSVLAWREPVIDLGYTVGFLMVILGRMQLFTEQTIVTVLPLMAEPGWRRTAVAVRLWTVVLIANLVGTCAAAAMNVFLGLVGADLLSSMVEVSSKLTRVGPLDIFLHAIPAGFLIASVAWIRAAASSGEFWIIVVLTYTIALCGFTHVVAGAAETFLLLFVGQVTIVTAIFGIILPAMIGNIIGGAGLFALLAHAQVRQEM